MEMKYVVGGWEKTKRVSVGSLSGRRVGVVGSILCEEPPVLGEARGSPGAPSIFSLHWSAQHKSDGDPGDPPHSTNTGTIGNIRVTAVLSRQSVVIAPVSIQQE